MSRAIPNRVFTSSQQIQHNQQSMSLLASVIPGNPPVGNQNQNPQGNQNITNTRYISPTIQLNSDGLEKLQFQQGNTDQNAAATSAQSLRFYLPMVLDSVNEVSYKVNVPNFANLPPLRLGSKYISDLLRIDTMIPGDLYGTKNLTKSSGLDNYYFDAKTGLGNFSRFEKVSLLDLPDRFFEEYNLTECSTKMGLFPEINRSWISVDNKLILWNYKLPQSSFNKSSQFLTIDQIRHSILAVKLVNPKKGVFLEEVNHLLLIATTMDIHIYVVKYDSKLNNLDVFNPNLSVNVHGLIVNNFIQNPSTNEVYFSGEGDGVNVWRLDYSKNVSFMKNKCDKTCLTKSGLSSVLPIGKIPGFDLFHSEQETVNSKNPTAPKVPVPEALVQLEIDPERNLLYSLSNKSIIRVYKLAQNQEQFLQHTQLTPTEIFKSLSQIIPESGSIKSFLKFRIVSIHSISQKESSNIQLIATTNYGNRITFKLGASTSYPSFMSAASRLSSSIRLSVVSMRFPPAEEEPKLNPELDSFTRIKQFVSHMVSNQQNSELLRNTKFAKMFSPGVFLAVKKTKSSDRLFISSVNYGFLKHNNKLVEDAEFVSFAENSSAETSPTFIHDIVQLTGSMNASDSPNGYANILASQYTKKPLQFAVLTNYGISIYQYRTSDKVISSLEDKVIENFIEENGYEETCSTLLYLACSYGHRNPDDLFKKKAQLLFSHAGNNARLLENNSTATSQHHAPIQPSEVQPIAEQVVLSDRFYGTCLLISRLFKEFWNSKVFVCLPHIKILHTGSLEVASVRDDKLIIKGLMIQKQQVEFFIGSVIVLLEFFDENANKIPGLNAPTFSSDPAKIEHEVCARAEHIAFTSILRSLNSMKEALSFLMVLIEETESNQNNSNEIFKFLSLSNQLNLLSLKFKDLLLPTAEVKNLIKDLLSSIINKNILKGGSIDLIATSLQGRCGSFCSSDDVYTFKAIENLTRAKNIGLRDTEMKIKCLNNAVSLFEQASDSLTVDNIQNSIDIMLSLDFYTGAVEFLLKLCKRLYGVSNVHQNNMIGTGGSDSNQIKNKFEENNKKRVQLYDLIFKILAKLDVKAVQISETGNQLLINDFIEVRDLTYDTCFACGDKAFHYDFYRWFINRGCSERLLTVDTPFILAFLEEASQNDLALTDLLWLYHAKRESYFPAARILYSLSISDFQLSLRKRIEYLSRATGFCNCTCPPSLRQEMIQLSTLINDLFEVANVQLDLLTAIEADSRINVENQKIATDALDFKIQSASELFNSFADPLGYYEICFTIFCISDYKNPDDIFKRWDLYFERIYHDYISDKKKTRPFSVILSDSITAIGTRIHTNDFVFPVSKLVKLMCKYIENATEDGAEKPPRGIVIDTFLNAGISYETLHGIIRGLIQHNSYDMYTGFTKYLKESEMVYLINTWYKNDKKLMEVIPRDVILTMSVYSVEADPIAKFVKRGQSYF